MANKYDTKKLKDDITIQSACDMVGIPVSRNGFIKCPDHLKTVGKLDSRASNCKIYPHSYICYACGAKGDIFSLVKGYKESYEGEVISFQGAAKILAQGTGNENAYIISRSEKDEEEKDPFPMSDKVLAFCGLSVKTTPLKIPVKMAYSKSDIPKNMEVAISMGKEPDDDMYVGYAFKGSYGIKNLYRDDPEAFWIIVYPKLLSGMDKLSELKDILSSMEYRELFLGISAGLDAYKKRYHITTDGKDEKKHKKQLLNSLF